MRTRTLLLALGALACSEPAPIPAASLALTADTLRVPFAEVTAGAWLGGERYAVISPADERELSRLQREVATDLYAAGRPDLVPWLDWKGFVALVPDEVPSVDAAKVARIDELVDVSFASGLCRCTVVAFAPDRLPGPLTEG